jgi:phytoene dehydrogenase-like protein
MPSGDYLWRVNDHGKTHREIARHSRVDAEAYDEFGKAMQAMCRFVKPILSMVPPDPNTLNPKELMKLLFIGRRFQGMSSDDKYNQVQLMTMSAIDFLDQWFETDVLKATMSASGIIGTFLGVRSPGTAYVLLHHYMGEIDGAFRAWGFARGGTGAISNAIADAAREPESRFAPRPPSPRSSSKTAKPKAWSSPTATKSTPTQFPRASIPPHLQQIHRSRSSSRRLSRRHQPLQVPRLVRQGEPGARWPAEFQMPARTGRSPARRHLHFPSASNTWSAPTTTPSTATSRAIPTSTWSFPRSPIPRSRRRASTCMSCFVQYAPYKLRPGLNWDDQKEAFGDTVINTIAEYAPNIKDIILHRQVVTPLDLEREWGLSEGNIFQGELSLEQLFFLRPAPGYARFRTPIQNLYMCGSATHPGGGIMGAPGRLAALSHEILKDKGAA